MKRFFCLLAALMSISYSAHSTTINGLPLLFEWVFGDTLDSVIPSPVAGSYVVGTEFQTIFFSQVKVGVSDNQVRLEWIADSQYNSSMTYNGLKLSDSFGVVPDFLLFQQVAGSGLSNVTTEFDTETLFINFADSGETLSGSTALFEFRLSDTTSSVPVPAPLPMLVMGLCGIQAFRRRRYRK